MATTTRRLGRGTYVGYALGSLAFQPNELQQADLRNGVAIATASDDECRYDRKRKRDFDFDRGAVTDLALHADAAAVHHPQRPERDTGRIDGIVCEAGDREE